MLMKSIIRKTAFCLALVSTLTSCGQEQPKDNKITVVDMLGETVEITKNPKKVACISRTTYDLLIAYGLGNKIDGVLKTVLANPWTEVFYPESKNHFAYEYKVNYELLLSRGVDLVFSPEKYITDGLREHGINAVNVSLYGNPTFDNYVSFFSNLVTQIWDDNNVKTKAEKWNSKVNTAISTIESELEKANVTKQKLFYVRGDSDKGIGYTDTASSFSEFAYRILNFNNYSSTASYADTNPSIETIAEYNPDVIVCGGIYAKKHINDVLANPILSTLDVVKNNKVYSIPTALTQMEQLNALTPEFFYQQANVLYPNIFNFDVKGMIKESTKEYFNTDLSDQQIEFILDCKNPTGGELY